MSADRLRDLRDAMERHDDWPTVQTGRAVIDAARAVLRDYDAWQAYIQHAAKETVPPEVVAELMAERTLTREERHLRRKTGE